MKNPLTMVALLLIKGYRRFISPLFPPCCRYYPSCSTYSLEVFLRFGFLKGLWLSLKRVLRCNPFFKGGVDPPPEKFSFFNSGRGKS